MKKILYILALFPMLAIGQTTSENYTKVTTYRKPTTVIVTNPADTVAKLEITYYDGLGRPIQKIANKQSATGKNIVTHIEYDAMGRIEKEYLPYVTTNGTLDFISDGQANTLNYSDYQGQNPYSQKFFEASALNRVLIPIARICFAVDSAEFHSVPTKKLKSCNLLGFFILIMFQS